MSSNRSDIAKGDCWAHSYQNVMAIVFLVAVHSAEPIVCHAALLVDMKKSQAAGIHMGIGPRCQTQPLGRATDVPLIVEDDMAVRINVSPALHSFTEALVGFIDEKGTPSINDKAKNLRCHSPRRKQKAQYRLRPQN